MRIQLIRNATLWIEYAGLTILVDPMFSEAGANPPIINSSNDRRNPLVPLPVDQGLLSDPDLVLVSHLHLDHWDPAAAKAVSKSAAVFCQPGDEETLQAAGFSQVQPVESSADYQRIQIHRTSGRHGTGEIGVRMGQVSGYVLQAEGEPDLYLAGDTIWCDEVEAALVKYRPQITVVHAGGARFVTGDPIIMDEQDVIQLARCAPYTRIVAVHMEAINHCLITREDLKTRLSSEGLGSSVHIPLDGEWMDYGKSE
ncbi:MBL fold metallo-hydrolase [Paenibacillus zeisoli]|uniref:MBL fold metallo-hydrolase n=1 Tax=Paenibacillus zeisoli TaxID=2496267 RepID=A0A433X4I9_9BACL|nr:MBL fold metallo-hydrolase [Paenibacillus zeisoli]RUT28996.1 MBL fold metallo-hydrolase [Paenibacillus zeisoli]